MAREMPAEVVPAAHLDELIGTQPVVRANVAHYARGGGADPGGGIPGFHRRHIEVDDLKPKKGYAELRQALAQANTRGSVVAAVGDKWLVLKSPALDSVSGVESFVPRHPAVVAVGHGHGAFADHMPKMKLWDRIRYGIEL